jgi:hypothetical protein
MAILDTLLFGFVAVLLGFKIFLLAAATILLVLSMSNRISNRQSVAKQRIARTHRLDVHA